MVGMSEEIVAGTKAGNEPWLVSLAPASQTSDKERDFANILSAISRAQQQRNQLKLEFQLHNTLKYCLLEAGAETFELSLVYVRQVVSIFQFVKAHLSQLLPGFKVALPLLSAPAMQKTVAATEEDPKLVELRKELDMLRAQMQQMTMGNKGNHPSGTPEMAQQSQLRDKLEPAKDKPVSNAPRPLPFNADMLISAKKAIKTPVKANDRSAPPSKRPPPKEDQPESIQAVLQRALQEKFKNVRLAEKEDLDSSFDGAGPSTFSFRSQSPPRQQESNPWRATAQDTTKPKTDVRNVPRPDSENRVVINAGKPQVPPRPKLSKVSATEPKKKILAEQNSY